MKALPAGEAVESTEEAVEEVEAQEKETSGTAK